MNPTNEFQPLIDSIFIEKVLRARATPPERKFMEGLELFEEVQERMRAGVRMQHPEFTTEQVEKEVSRRFKRIRQIEEHGIYQALP